MTRLLPIKNYRCESCGAYAAYCPTDALMDGIARLKANPVRHASSPLGTRPDVNVGANLTKVSDLTTLFLF